MKFAAVTGGTVAEAVFRTYTDGEPNAFQSMTEYNGAGTTRYGYAAANTDGETVDFKCRFFNSNDEGSYYSELLSVDPLAIDNTKPAAPSLTLTSEFNSGTGQYDYTLKAKVTQMHVAKLSLERLNPYPAPGNWVEVVSSIGRPEVELVESGSASSVPSYRAIAYASDGTESDPATP